MACCLLWFEIITQHLFWLMSTTSLLVLQPTCFWIDNIKVQYLQFMAHMKTPQYRSNLQQLLEQEKVNSNYRNIKYNYSGFYYHIMTRLVMCHVFIHVIYWKIICNLCNFFSLCHQQKHRDLSGQVEQLHFVCQSHKDKIKGLFQTKLDEVGAITVFFKHASLICSWSR